MKKTLSITILAILSLCCIIVFAGCGENEHPTYTITWKNYDGSILEVDSNVEYGTTPSYDGKTPTKPSDSQYSYSFNGWSPETSSVVSNKTYTAQFTQSGRLCTVYFNLNGGSSPSYSSSKQISAIAKENFFFNVEKNGYNFRGWAYKGTKVFDEYGNIVGNVQLVSGMTFDALFVDKVKLTIVKNIEGAGNVIGGGEYAFNSEVDIKVIPNDGYEFIGWYYNDDVLSNQTTYKYKMWDKDLILEARFQVSSYKLQIDSNNSDKGLVAIDPSGIFSALEYSASTNKSIKWKQSVKIAAYSKTEQTRFLGWYDDEGNLVSTNAVYEFEMPLGDINYHAKWNCFSIQYNMNGGTNNPSNPTIYDVDSGNIELLTPTKSGATFVAWYYDGKIIKNIDTSIKSNITVEAVWSNTYYTVKYSLDGGKSYTTVNYSPADGYTLANPTKTGYTFSGWTGSNGTTPQKNIVIKSKEIGNRTYVANWQISTYSITYSLNGGNLSNKVTSYTVEDQNIQLATPTRDYYNFSKWQIDGEDVTYINTSLAKNLTVVAIWTPIDYTITYNLDGGTASNATKYNVETSTFTLINPTRSGYKFIGWTGSNGSTPQMSVSIAKGGHTNLTYKANWEVNNYSISYVLNGGKNNASNKTTYNINSGTISLYNPTRDYYNFKEWQLNGQKVTSISSSSTLKDITLTAIWTPIDYTITYDLDGGTTNNKTKYNIETSTFTLDNPAKEGYTFIGWTGSNGSTLQMSVSIAKGGHCDLSYTANWQINQYTLTFVSNGGSTVDSITQNYGTQLNIEKPTYYEKSFAGWFDSTLTTEYKLTTMPAENLILYAKWVNYEVVLSFKERAEISVYEEISADTFTASAVDTDGNPIEVIASLLGTPKEIGESITIRLVAAGLYETFAVKTIFDIKVYGNPVIDYNEGKNYINLSDIINASLFSVTSNDTFGNDLPVSISIKEGTYEAGDTVTIVLKSTDVAKNTTTVEVENVKVYGGAVFTRNEEIISIKDSDVISNELFGVSATDHFGAPLNVTTELFSGSKTAGKTITVKSSATDCKGNTSYITYQIKVYGTPSISNATKTDFKVEDEITLSTLGIVAKDNFGVVLSNVTLVLTEGTQTAGQTLTYKVTATDTLGNVAEKDISGIRVYGVPTLAYDCERLNYNQNPLEYVAPVTVSFNLNGGSGSITSQTIDGTQGLVYPSVPTRSGYAFAGWYTTSSCSTLFDFSANVTSDTTIYAKWVAMTSSYNSREYVDIANYNSSSSKKTISISASSSSSQNYYYFTCYAAGTYTLYSAYTSGDFYITAYNVTKGSTVLSKYNLYSSQSSKSATFTANAGDVIYIALYKYSSSGSTGSGTFYVTGVNYPKAGGLSVKKGVDYSLLNIVTKDSFEQDLIPEVTIKEGTFEGGKTVVYTLSVTDIAGNKKVIDTAPIKVYSPENISLTYSVNSNKIKLSSHGEEFNAVAVNSFGEQCAIHLEAADGCALTGGNVVNLYLVATDILGNTTKSDLITNINVYDIPIIKYYHDIYSIGTHENPYSLFVVLDSFGNELSYDINIIDGSLAEKGNIVYELTAVDKAKNELRENVNLQVFDENEISVKLKDDVTNEYEYILIPLNCDIKLPLKNREHYTFVGWAHKGELITDSQGVCNIKTLVSGWYEFNAVFEPIEYHINYITNGGILPTTYKNTYNVLENLVNLPNPELENAKFVAWYLDADFKEAVDGQNNIYCEDISLYAKYSSLIFQINSNTITGLTTKGKTLNRIEIPSNFNGINITTINSYALGGAPYLEKVIIPTTVENIESIAFVAMYGEHRTQVLTIYCQHELQPDGFLENWNFYKSNISYPVVWNYTGEIVNYCFETNGGNTINSVNTDALLTLPLPHKEGYYFVGWYLDESLSDCLVKAPFSSQTDVVLYAKWTTDEYEIDNRISIWETAQIVSIGSYIIHLNQSSQKLSFTPTSSGSYNIYTTGSCASYIHILDESQHEIGYAIENYVSGYYSDFKNSRITISLDANKTYYIFIGSNGLVSGDKNYNTLYITRV